MKRTQQSRQHPLRQASLAIAVGILLGFSQAALAVDPEQDALENFRYLNDRTFDELARAQILPSPAEAIPPSDLFRTALRTNGYLAVIGVLGTNDPGFVAPVSPDNNRLTSLRLYAEANAQYQTLVARCEHWRDFADNRSLSRFGDPDDIGRRLSAIAEGSNIGLVDVTPVFADPSDIEAMRNAIDAFTVALNDPPIAGADLNRLSTLGLTRVLDNFWNRVNSVCPE